MKDYLIFLDEVEREATLDEILVLDDDDLIIVYDFDEDEVDCEEVE